MLSICRYNEDKDICEVDQYGFVDLVECLNNGVVPSSISNTESDYNDIEDPASILGKPRDVFEAYKMGDYIKERGKKTESIE